MLKTLVVLSFAWYEHFMYNTCLGMNLCNIFGQKFIKSKIIVCCWTSFVFLFLLYIVWYAWFKLISKFSSYFDLFLFSNYSLIAQYFYVAFKSLGKLIFDVGLMLAFHCDRYGKVLIHHIIDFYMLTLKYMLYQHIIMRLFSFLGRRCHLVEKFR